MKDIDIGILKQTPYDNLQFATEVAWAALVDRAIQDGLLPKGDKPNGLMYMPTQGVTQQFKNACRAVIKDLGGDVQTTPLNKFLEESLDYL
jgi:hypothetical protein